MKLKELAKSKKTLNFLAGLFMAVGAAPVSASAGVASQTLTTVGLPLIQLLILGAFGWILAYVLSALGQGQLAGMTKVVVVFSCLGLVVNVVWTGISTIAKLFGLSL